MANLLSVAGVTRIFRTTPPNYALEGVSFELPETAEILSVVGESGCGKSTLARIILGLLEPTEGEVLFAGKPVSAIPRLEFYRQVQAIFQNPYGVFNPVYRVDRIFRVPIRKFQMFESRAEADRAIDQALRAVGLHPGEVLRKFPHQLSGGQRQRLMLARIHLLRPRLIIADEPVSMVDAVQRASFLELILQLRNRFGISTIFITHDLSTARYLGGRILVLYRGRIVEQGDTIEVTSSPGHPYTRLLMQSMPIPDPQQRWSTPLEIRNPNLSGSEDRSRECCQYADRCPDVIDICHRQRPSLAGRLTSTGSRITACHLYQLT